MKHKKKKHHHSLFNPQNIDNMLIHYAKTKQRTENLPPNEVTNLITYWRNRIKAYHYFILIGYKNTTPIYYSINTGVTNSFFNNHDSDSKNNEYGLFIYYPKRKLCFYKP